MNEPLSLKMLRLLRRAKSLLSREACRRIAQYVASQATPHGLFTDKCGGEDIYYTAFGWMLSYLFGVGIPAGAARRRLQNMPAVTGDLVRDAAYARSTMLLDLMSGNAARLFLNAAMAGRNAAIPVFSVFPHHDCRSPYSQFVRLSLAEDLRREVEDKHRIASALEAYRVPTGGGYSNLPGGAAASVSATAAALSVRGQLEGYVPVADTDYLYRVQDASGGFFAAEGAAAPDMLSTAVALFALHNCGRPPRVHPAPFVEAHWLESGSFASTLFDETGDVEYTFYGLLALGTC
ncbi:MAG: hypothetical protein LBP64_03145 [Tannerella sp.]|jgi:prenyltransferase beta subunit|nr:hypothetical protein [Tannerella sp.]